MRPNLSKSYLLLLSGLDRSNFLVLIERFLHWYNESKAAPDVSQHPQKHLNLFVFGDKKKYGEYLMNLNLKLMNV